jgi:hypothetical protein
VVPFACGACGACVRCRLVRKNPARWAPVFGLGRSRVVLARLPCRWEGEVLESAPCGCGLKAVRECLHEGNDDGRCTRGPNNGAVRACAACPDHAPA